jgi:hypothetical protein
MTSSGPLASFGIWQGLTIQPNLPSSVKIVQSGEQTSPKVAMWLKVASRVGKSFPPLDSNLLSVGEIVRSLRTTCLPLSYVSLTWHAQMSHLQRQSNCTNYKLTKIAIQTWG